MRISDWSSDVCSSDLKVPARTILEPLYREELVWIASVHNPVARHPVSLAPIATHQRLPIAVGKSFDGASAILSEGGLERRVVAGLGSDGSSSSEAGDPIARSEGTKSELQSLMRIWS